MDVNMTAVSNGAIAYPHSIRAQGTNSGGEEHGYNNTTTILHERQVADQKNCEV